MEHPIRYETLIAYALGEEDTEATATHIAGCSECRSTISRLQSAQATVAWDARFAPSPAALARVLDLMPRSADRIAAPFDSLRRLIATLTFDSRSAYAAAGLRGSSDSYLLSYSRDDATLDLEIEPPQSSGETIWRLTGQLDVPGLVTPADIAVVGDRGTNATVSSDSHGVFSVDLDPGRYKLLVSLNDAVIVFPEVEVG